MFCDRFANFYSPNDYSSRQIKSEVLEKFITSGVISLIPKAGLMDFQALVELYELAKDVYMAA